MTFTIEQRKKAYDKLPPDIQDLALSNETAEMIEALLKGVNLNEEQASLADTGILYALLCMQSLDDAINDIAKLSGKNISDLSNLKESVQNNVLAKYDIDVNELIKENTQLATNSLVKPTNLPQTSSETHPMIEEGEIAHDIPLPGERGESIIKNEAPVPANLPAHEPAPEPASTLPPSPEPKKETQPMPPMTPKSFYPPGQDPYREPAE